MANHRNSIPSQLQKPGGGSSSETLLKMQEDAIAPGPALSLSAEEQIKLEELKRLDQYVREHEQLHANIGGEYATSPQFEFERGPDGNLYAIGGKVSIDVSPVPNDPEATIRKMQQVRAAALAPSDPSAQDHVVALEAQARMAEVLASKSGRDLDPSTDQSAVNDEEQSEATYDELDEIFSRVSAEQAGGLPKGLQKETPASSELNKPTKGQNVKSDA